MILDTIDRFSAMEALPNFSGLIGYESQQIWEEISTYLYLLVAAMIKGNHSNCAQFAALQRLDWLFSRLSNPQSAEGILDVLYCVLTESPEALNMINDGILQQPKNIFCVFMSSLYRAYQVSYLTPGKGRSRSKSVGCPLIPL